MVSQASTRKEKSYKQYKRKLKTAHNEQRRLGRLTSNSALPAGDDGEESELLAKQQIPSKYWQNPALRQYLLF
jgi:hypothetical protein